MSRTNTKVLKQIHQHRQVMTNLYQYDFPYTSIADVNITIDDFPHQLLRELILQLKTPSNICPFLAVERKSHWGQFDGGLDIIYVQANHKEASHVCNNLGYYLKQQFGEKILKFFDVETQTSILETKLDKDGRPISVDEIDFDESNAMFEKIGFNMSITPEVKVPTSSTIMNKVQLDQDSVSTFASTNKSVNTLFTGEDAMSDTTSVGTSFSLGETDSMVSALSAQSSMKSEITTLTNSVSKLSKHLRNLQRQTKKDREDQDQKIEESKQDFIKSNEKTQVMLQALLNKYDNPSANDEQVGVV